MSDVHTCPTCQGKAKPQHDSHPGAGCCATLQDQELIRKIAQLKKLLDRKEQELSALRAQVEAMEGAQVLLV